MVTMEKTIFDIIAYAIAVVTVTACKLFIILYIAKVTLNEIRAHRARKAYKSMINEFNEFNETIRKDLEKIKLANRNT